MQEARVPITSRAECRTAYASAGIDITATMLCAGRTNLDTCQGDSGGPLFFKAAGPGYIQVGITQLGHRLRRDRLPRGLHPPQQPGGGEFHPLGDRGRPGELGTSRLTAQAGAQPAADGWAPARPR